MTVGERIKWLRRKNKMTQEQLAFVIGVTRRTVVNWERGKTCICFSDAIKVCRKFGCTLDQLIGGVMDE